MTPKAEMGGKEKLLKKSIRQNDGVERLNCY
jgi:hypothetical protein